MRTRTARSVVDFSSAWSSVALTAAPVAPAAVSPIASPVDEPAQLPPAPSDVVECAAADDDAPVVGTPPKRLSRWEQRQRTAAANAARVLACQAAVVGLDASIVWSEEQPGALRARVSGRALREAVVLSPHDAIQFSVSTRWGAEVTLNASKRQLTELVRVARRFPSCDIDLVFVFTATRTAPVSFVEARWTNVLGRRGGLNLRSPADLAEHTTVLSFRQRAANEAAA